MPMLPVGVHFAGALRSPSYRPGVSRMKTLRFVPLVGSILLVTTSVLAQDQANLSTARTIAMQGLSDYDAGRYEEARDKLARAYAVVKLPTLGRDCARALVKLGRYVEAAELYLEVTRLQIKGGDKAGQEQAKEEAAAERAALLPKIPQLVIILKGVSAEEASVEVDGVQVPSALLGVGRLVNPGSHQIKGTARDQTREEKIEIAEGVSQRVTLSFDAPAPTVEGSPTSAGLLVAPKDPSSTSGGQPDALPDKGGQRDGSLERTLGWVSLGVGGGALVLGSVTGIMALSQRDELDQGGCSDGHCYADQSDDVDGYNTLRTLSTVGFVAGGVLAATGGVLLLTSPSKPATGASRVTPWVGLGSAGMSGRF